MAEISSLASSPKGMDFAALPERDERGRKGDQDVMPFGQLVSAQARPAHAPGRAAPPAPLERPVEKAAPPSKSRDEQSARRAEESPSNSELVEKRGAPDGEQPVTERDHRPDGSEGEHPTCGMTAPAEEHAGVSTEPGETSSGHCGGTAELPADTYIGTVETPAGVQAEPVELPVGPFIGTAEMPAGVQAQPVETPAGLFVGPVEVPVAVIGAVDAEAEAVVAALGAVGQGGKLPKTGTDIAAPELATPTGDAPAASPAEAFGKLATKGLEARSASRPAGGEVPAKGPAAPDLPKTNFGDWISDFAVSQGALHRSGDLVGSLDRAFSALPTPHAGQDALRPTPLQMLPIEIGMQAMRGVTKFQIRLDPAELGRVDVQLEIKEDGQVKANLVVDRVETLAMLRRDASTLQQAFEQAGLRQSADGLQFSLRGEGQQNREGQREGGPHRDWSAEDEKLMGDMPPEFAMRRVMIPNSSLDLMV